MFDVNPALEFLARDVPLAEVPAGVPAHELLRSPAAARVGALAAEVGLFQFHFEHRRHLELPESLCEEGADTLPPTWQDGQLAEPKYQSFRLDLPIGSFHPGHRAKWSTHELCHALVGFAWRPDASPLWHATAARLAEVLPVVLWYFLDEVRLSRCPRHEAPTFRAFCPACERAAMSGPRPLDAPRDREHLEDGARFLDRELAAIARTRRDGIPVHHIHGSLDLCSDGIAYAKAHGPRLSSEPFARFASSFLDESPGFARSLDALEARVLDVARAITEGKDLEKLAESAAVGRARFTREDLGWRLLLVREETDGDAARELDRIIDALAGGASVSKALAWYEALEEDYFIPSWREVFAVGYDVDGVESRSVEQVAEGLATVCPLTLSLLDKHAPGTVAAFVAEDLPRREPLGARFVAWLERSERVDATICDLARYESALRTARGEADLVALGADGEGWRLADGVVVLRLGFDPSAMMERVEAGRAKTRHDDKGRLGLVVKAEPTGWVIGRDAAGEVVLAELSADDAAALTAGDPIEADVEDALLDLGLAVRTRYAM